MSTLFSKGKHKANTTELHPIVRQTCFLHPLVIIVSVSALYYYCYKRAGLSIADPRFYEDLSWVKEEKLSR